MCVRGWWRSWLPTTKPACFSPGATHKLGGPKGVGLLKCPAKGRVEPLLRGGPQEEGRRAGTENVASILSMLAALEARERLMRDTNQPTPSPSQEGSDAPTRAASSPLRLRGAPKRR